MSTARRDSSGSRGSASASAADKHSLKGTRYGRMEEEVQRMLQQRQGQGQEQGQHSKKRTRDSPQRQTHRDRDNRDSHTPSKKNKKSTSSKSTAEEEEEPKEEEEEEEEEEVVAVAEKKTTKKDTRVPPASPASTASTARVAKPTTSTAPTVVPDAAQGYTNDRTVYLQGLPFTCEESEVREFFSGVGKIESIRLPRWHDSGKLKGYGHVQFVKADDADKALELSGSYIKDRFITVDKPLVPRALAQDATSVATKVAQKPPGCKTIFIRNLPYEISEAEIREKFMVYGPILKVRLAVWNHTSNLKGFGYIDFKREDSADIAVKKTGNIVIQSRIISVDYESGAPKAGYKGDKVLQPPKKEFPPKKQAVSEE